MVPFDEKRNVVDREAPLRGSTQDRPRARLNDGVGDGIEPSDAPRGSFASENPGGQECPVQTAILPDEVVSELSRDLGKRWFSRLEYLSRNGIGVGDDSSLGREDARHR